MDGKRERKGREKDVKRERKGREKGEIVGERNGKKRKDRDIYIKVNDEEKVGGRKGEKRKDRGIYIKENDEEKVGGRWEKSRRDMEETNWRESSPKGEMSEFTVCYFFGRKSDKL